MPRPPLFESPLRSIRDALGLSQGAFADELGVSQSYIQSIESGRRVISDDLASEITIRYGFTLESVKQMMGTPVSVLGVKTSLTDAIDAWKRQLDTLERNHLDALLAQSYQRLLEVARAHGKAAIAKVLLVRWLVDTARKIEFRGVGSESNVFPNWMSSIANPAGLIAFADGTHHDWAAVFGGQPDLTTIDFASLFAERAVTPSRSSSTSADPEK